MKYKPKKNRIVKFDSDNIIRTKPVDGLPRTVLQNLAKNENYSPNNKT